MDKETQKMFDILHENKKKQQMNKTTKKESQVKKILLAILLFAVIIILSLLIKNMDKDFIKNCVANGVSEYACKKAQ